MGLRRSGIVPVLMAMVVASPVAAQSPSREQQLETRREQLRQKWERQFREADRDESRGLTPAEIEAAGLPRSLLKRFAEIDVDGNGELSPEELLDAQQQRVRSATPSTVDP